MSQPDSSTPVSEPVNDPTLAEVRQLLVGLHSKVDDLRSKFESYHPGADSPNSPSDEGFGVKPEPMLPADIASVYSAISDQEERRKFARANARALRKQFLQGFDR